MTSTFFRPYLYRNVYIVGSKLLDITFWVISLFCLSGVLYWVFHNSGHIKVDNYSHSTVVLKTQEAIETNYSPEDFNTTYVKSNEFENYNRVWDRIDIVKVFPDEIYFTTNMVITANQTRGLCPDNPVIRNVECDPNNNTCRKGFRSSNGIHTGRCVRADFPLNHTYQLNNGYACQLKGWCPVDRMLLPLKKYRPVLIETINSTLYIDNSVEFPKYNIVINNLLHNKCQYDPVHSPDCPVFKLGDIIKFTKNSGQDFEEMAIFGGTIDINIEWKCYWRIFQSNIDECKPSYSFRRVDVWGTGSQLIYYTDAYPDSNNDKRTFIKSFKIRFAIKVVASLSYFDWFHFITIFMAYSSAFTLMFSLFRRFARFVYISNEFDEVIEARHLRHGSHWRWLLSWFRCFNRNPEPILPFNNNNINDREVLIN